MYVVVYSFTCEDSLHICLLVIICLCLKHEYTDIIENNFNILKITFIKIATENCLSSSSVTDFETYLHEAVSATMGS